MGVGRPHPEKTEIWGIRLFYLAEHPFGDAAYGALLGNLVQLDVAADRAEPDRCGLEVPARTDRFERFFVPAGMHLLGLHRMGEDRLGLGIALLFRLLDEADDTVRRGRELYYGFTQWLDEEIGKVLAALQASGLAEETMIVYTADHGENLGEHGLWWKNCLFDSAARVPLIISWPKR